MNSHKWSAPMPTAAPTHPLSLTHYIVIANLGPRFGWIPGDDLHEAFHKACEAWEEHMSRDEPAYVVEVKLNAPALDVTPEARQSCIDGCISNNRDLPNWLLDEPEDDMTDADHIAAERMQRGWDEAKEACYAAE